MIEDPTCLLSKGHFFKRNGIIPHTVIPVAAVGLLFLAACANQGVPLSVAESRYPLTCNCSRSRSLIRIVL
jgi:hypothetical protein